MDAVTSQLVRQRAGNRCEYCRLPEEFSALRFHIEHIVDRQHGGTDDPDNLALACTECNFHKGRNLTGVDPEAGQVTRLFHPRRDRWEDHFAARQPPGRKFGASEIVLVIFPPMPHLFGMKVATINEVQSNFKSLIRSVEQGDEIEIRRRNKPIARIVPIRSKHLDWSDAGERLWRIYGRKVVRGKPTHTIVAEDRGDH